MPTIGRFNRNVNINLNASLDARVDFIFAAATYTLAQPVWGGQFAIGLATAGGHNDASISGTLTATLGPLTVTRSGGISSRRRSASVGALVTIATVS